MVLFNTIALIASLTCIAAAPVIVPHPLLHKRSSLSGKFIHITDIHLDLHYKNGAATSNLCHRTGSKSDAGMFGALGSDCDTPTALADAAFDFLKNNMTDIDFVIYTGDTVRHDRDTSLSKSSTDVVNAHTAVRNYFQKAYNLNSIPVIPTIGNNDAYVHDMFVKTDPIFSTLENIWKPMNLNLSTTFSHGGYFIQEVIANKLSIVNLNSMYFYKKNTAIGDCSDSTSPAYEEMKWLKNIFKTYNKKNGHNLYVMGHIPPVDENGKKLYKSACYTQYFDLFGKYGNIITGHFNGHTNEDTLHAVYESSSKKYTFKSAHDTAAANIKTTLTNTGLFGIFNAPSIIPKYNPAIRVYKYETSASSKHSIGTILDWDQYYLDLKKANEQKVARFELEYTASKFYGVDNFSGKGVGEAVYNVASSPAKVKTYLEHMVVQT